jgi:branched-chain amino acid aminotransferase
MVVFINGEFVSEDRALLSAFDRGFLLGDGLFETVLVQQRVPFRWAQHAERLQRGAALLRLPLPMPVERLRSQVAELIRRNGLPDGVLRITVSRGPGPRGYSIAAAGPSTLVMALHPAPPPMPDTWRVATSSIRLVAGDPLAGVKTCSKACQVAARTEAEARDADEALLLNTDGQVAEGAGSNLFWVEGGRICTPPLSAGILPGITRALVLELCTELSLPACESNGTLETLFHAEGVFFTLSTWGIIPASELEARPLPHSPLVDRLQAAYQTRLLTETSKT